MDILGVPIFTLFWGPHYEYRDPLLPVKVHSNTGGMGSVLKTCQVQDE